MKKIGVIGEIVVEIMAQTTGDGFLDPVPMIGPFPSGAPAIFIDQAARMGQPCGIVSAVGNDDFGALNIRRLSRDGVDVSAISVDPDYPTGTAFVRYRPDGTRKFVFNIRHSACGRIRLDGPARTLLDSVDHLHVMGSSLFSEDILQITLTTMAQVKARGGTVSFDPNLRKEMVGSPAMRLTMDRILAFTDLFLPSGDELCLLTQSQDEDQAVVELLARGPRAVLHKLGATGARYHDRTIRRFVPAFPVVEVDPTGAGDCFGAAFTCMWLRDAPLDQALAYAAAAGALAVTRKGPMEGASSLAEIQDLVASVQR